MTYAGMVDIHRIRNRSVALKVEDNAATRCEQRLPPSQRVLTLTARRMLECLATGDDIEAAGDAL